MNAHTENTDIQNLIETYRQLVIAKDIDRLMGLYADNLSLIHI